MRGIDNVGVVHLTCIKNSYHYRNCSKNLLRPFSIEARSVPQELQAQFVFGLGNRMNEIHE